MNNQNQSSHWKTMLPGTFHWLNDCNIEPASTTVQGAHHLVLLNEASDKNSPALKVDAPGLSEAQRTELAAQAKKYGIKKGAPITGIIFEDTPYLLAWTPGLDVDSIQIGRQIGLELAKHSKSLSCETLVICAGEKVGSLGILEGYLQGLYKLDSFKGKLTKEKKSTELPSTIKLCEPGVLGPDIEKTKALGQALALTCMVEDAPANWLTPDRFAEIAEDMAKDIGIKCTIKKKEDLEELGMGAFLSVAAGSAISPYLIGLEIAGDDPSTTVALVGKGLTFDVGGLCLKPAGGLEEMKYDMCGGGSVLGAAYYLGKVKPPTNVVCMIGAVENMVGEKATRPGDIFTTYNGKTVEVINTDAEGRLVLADVLAYTAKTYNPALMIDVATLTGAVLVSLGSSGAGVMSNQQKAADYVLKVGKQSGEPLWQLPLWPELVKEIKSDFADYKNIVSPSVKAGTIAAGTFLKEFVGNTPWVHIDIAGTAWNCKVSGYPTSGASGFIVKTLANSCLQFEKLS